MTLGRFAGSLAYSGCTSGLEGGQGTFGWGRFRGPAVADHWLKSEVDDSEVPFDCEPFVATEVFDELEDSDEAELDLERDFRGANMPLTSSGSIGLLPLIVPHAGREI